MGMPKQIGPYLIDCLLGEGGMGVVYRARDPHLDREVAIKCLSSTGNHPEKQRERLRREAQILGRLEHPHIVKVYHTLEYDGAMCIVMEYVDGETLHDRIGRHGPLPVGEAVRLARQIAEGMAVAHKHDIIHRDLKGENVLLDRHGNPKLTDFGVAKVLGDKTLTEEGKSPGTLKAMSPEQIRGKPVTEASDLFSFGILLYETLTGELPFKGAGFDIVESIKNDDPPRLSTRVPGVPEALSHLVGMLLQKQAILRPRSFRDLIETLKQIEAALDDATAALTAPPAPAGFLAEGSTEDPVPPAESPEESEHAATPADPGNALVLHPSRQQPADVDAGEPAPARVSRRLLLLSIFGGVGVALAMVLAYWLSGRVIDRGDSGPGHLRLGPAPKESQPAPLTERREIAVLRPEIPEGCPHDPALVRRTLRYSFEQELLMLVGVEIISDDDVKELTDVTRPRDFAYALAADELLTISVDCYPDRLSLQLRRLDADGNLIQSVEPFDMEISDLGVSSITLRAKVRGLYSNMERKAALPASGGIPSAEDLERFQRLRQDYWQNHSQITPDAVLRELDGILTRSPDFVEGYIFAAEVEEYRYRVDRNVAHLRRARVLLQKAVELAPLERAPYSKLLYMRLVSVELRLDDPDSAEAELNELKTRDGQSAISMYLHALIEEERGNTDHAKQLLQQAASRHPSWRILYHQARLALALGDLTAAQQYLAALFQRSRNETVLQLWWQLQLLTRPADAAQLYYMLASDPPFSVRVNHALNLMSIGLYSQAIEILEKMHQERPMSAPALYSLAEAWRLDGEEERALETFEELLALLDQLPGEPLYQAIRAQALAHLGHFDEAREFMARALVRKQYIEIRYAAAVVYSLIGDDAEGARWAADVLDSGYSREWFHYPWFKAIRESPLLRERLREENTQPAPE
ncbi:MAG TPA: protein kinase [Haliangium sp.]|nr:protein kinase [Haliangium sp.]